MKRIIFLLVLTAFFSIQNTYADTQKDGVCLLYNNTDCIKFMYCTSKTSSGCNGSETCSLENGRFACVTNLDSNTKIYRPLNFVDEKVRNLRKPTYTSPIVEETLKRPSNDYFFPSREHSRYPVINQDINKTYYPQKDQPYTLDETLPRRDVLDENEPPYYKPLLKKKYPKRATYLGIWGRRR